MTVTEAPPTAPAETPAEPRPAPAGPVALIGSGDHKTIGRLWLAGAAVGLLLVVVVGKLLGLERVTVDELEILGAEAAPQLFSLYRVGIAFLVAMPLFLGLATVVVPLQVGAATIAFPRAAAAAFWAWLSGAILLCISYAIDGGVVATETLDPDAVALGLLALGIVVLALLVASVCVVATVIALRPRWMSLLQVPPFSWSMVVAGLIWLLSLPVLLVGIALAYLDLRYGQLLFAEIGGVPGALWDHLAWAFEQPQVYVVAIPVLGIAAEIVPVCAGVVQKGRGAVWAGIGGFGAFAFGAWAQTAYNPELVTEAVYVGVAFAIGLPTLMVIGGLADSTRRHRPALRPAFLFAVLAAFLLLAAVGAGAAGAVEPLELVGTSWQAGHLDLVFTSVLVAGLAGLCWWAPKIWGRHASTPLAFIGGLLLAGGGLVLAAGEGVAGALDQPLYSYVSFDPQDGVELFNLVATIGAALLALGAVLAVLAGVGAAVGKAPADDADDPWGGQTLEWAAPSPPPPGNFPTPVPEVTSATPLVADQEEGA